MSARPDAVAPRLVSVRSITTARRSRLMLRVWSAIAAGVVGLVLTPAAHATVSFLPAASYMAGAGTADVATGDFNQDGKLDIAATDPGSQSVSILRGVGDGTFLTTIAVPVGRSVNALTVADFDADGKLDLAFTAMSTNSVGILWGTGSADPSGFDGTVEYHGVGTAPQDVTAGDVNGDGRPDLATANNGFDYNASVLLALSSSRGFAPAMGTPQIGLDPSSIVLGDYDGDGHLDIAIAIRSAGAIRVQRGDGSGGFPTGTTYSTFGGTNAIAQGDINGNGWLDLVLAASGDLVTFFEDRQRAAGNEFQNRQDTSLAAGSTPVGIATGDFTGDGRADVATADSGTGTVTVLTYAGPGTPLSGVASYPTGAASPQSVTAADFNGDGVADLAVAHSNVMGSVSVLLSHGAPDLTQEATATAALGATITDTATLSGATPAATGTITFKLYQPGDTTCALAPIATTTQPVNGNGEYSSAGFAAPHAGTYRWTVSYSGDATNDAVAGSCATAAATVVAKVTPTATAAATASLALGDDVTPSATLADGATASGTLTFRAWTTADCSGIPAYTSSAVAVSGDGSYQDASAYTPPHAGTYRWMVDYSGDDDNATVASACDAGGATTVVDKAAPTLSTTDATAAAAAGGTITATARVAGGQQPTGTVTLSAFATADCSGTPAYESTPVAVSDAGNYTAPGFAAPHAGTYRWTASYSGDADNAAATTTCGAASTSEVARATPTLTGVATGGTSGDAIGDTATLTGGHAAGGTIAFSVWTTNDCSGTPAATSGPIAVSGDGDYDATPFTPTMPGVYRWTVAYSGDADNEPATTVCGAVGQTSTITMATLSVTPQSVDLGDVTVGTAATRSVTVTNTSSGPTAEGLRIGTLNISGAGFELRDDTCSGRTVAPGATCTVTVAFVPTSAGAVQGTVSIPSNADGSPHTVSLSGNATAVPAPDPPAPRPPAPNPPAPQLSGLSVTHCLGTIRGARRTVTARYTVNRTARVIFTLQRRVKPAIGARRRCPQRERVGEPGAYVDVRTRAATTRGTRAVPRKLTQTLSVSAGSHTFALARLLGRTTLTPGRYRIVFDAVDTAGVRVRKAVYFWVLVPPSKRR